MPGKPGQEHRLVEVVVDTKPLSCPNSRVEPVGSCPRCQAEGRFCPAELFDEPSVGAGGVTAVGAAEDLEGGTGEAENAEQGSCEPVEQMGGEAVTAD